MALTVSVTKKWQNTDANCWEAVGTIAFDSSYPTGGEALDLGDDCETIFQATFSHKGGYSFDLDYANQKVIAYYVDNNAAGDSAQIQVPDTTDLSTLTGVRFRLLYS